MLGSATEDDVAARLIRTAIALYGARGTQAVSAREIQRQAEVLNEAAVRYYFGDKLGLIGACLAAVEREFASLFNEAFGELDELKAAGGLSIRAVITALVSAVYRLQIQNPAAIQLLARLIREEGAVGQKLLLEHFGHMIWRLEDELRDLLPDKSADALRLHAFLAIHSTVNGMVDQNLLWRLPATRADAAHFQLAPDELAQGFIDYVTGGVSAASALN